MNAATHSQGKDHAHPFRHIVVGTDFSPAAASAAAWAASLAWVHGAHLTLVHAVRLPGPAPDFVAPSADFGSSVQEAARARLEEAANELARSGLEVHPRLVEGAPVAALLDVAREIRADLLVVGTRGLSGLPQLLLGSTAARLVEHAECPVLTTHGEAVRDPSKIRAVLVPTDFSPDSRAAAELAVHLLKAESDARRLILLHAFHLPIEYSAYGGVPVSPALLEEARIHAEAELRAQRDELAALGMEIETRAVAGEPASSICALAEAEDIDLIVMGTVGRTGAARWIVGSTAERVMQRSHCPVVTLRHRDDAGS